MHKTTDAESSSKENEEEPDNIYNISSSPSSRNGSPAQSFLEMLSSGPSRSPSPARPPTVDHEDLNNPSLTNWTFQRQESVRNNGILKSLLLLFIFLRTIIEHTANVLIVLL